MTTTRDERIRVLNDQLRTRHVGGRIFISAGLTAAGPAQVASALKAIASYSAFNEINDPYAEHDFGALTVGSCRVFWKIDYYDESLTSHAADPADEQSCIRVMTVMLAEEY